MGESVTSEIWKASVLTLFPEAFPGVLDTSVIGSSRLGGPRNGRRADAGETASWALEVVDIRDYGVTRHRNVDGPPAGGGAGMVLRPDVSTQAIDSVLDSTPSGGNDGRPLIYLTPRGAKLTQERVRELASGPGLVAFCGRFEGLDQRVIEGRDMEEICIGDFVLAGGEVAAQALIEACVRVLPGVLGNAESHREESFEDGLLEHPLYTKPREFEGRGIPDVLLSGDHKAIADWRTQQSEKITRERRPDLWDAHRDAVDGDTT